MYKLCTHAYALCTHTLMIRTTTVQRQQFYPTVVVLPSNDLIPQNSEHWTFNMLHDM